MNTSIARPAIGLFLVCYMFWAPLQVQAQTNEENPIFYVGLTNGKVLYPQSITLRERGFGSSYLILDGRDQVLLDNVLFYGTREGHFIYEPVEGSSRRTLMKREFEGPITLYSVTRIVYNNNGGAYDPYFGGYRSGGNVREKTDYYFRKENSPVLRYNYRNLRNALSDSPEAMEIMQEVGRTRFFIYSLYIGGGALSLYGMYIGLVQRRIPLAVWAGVILLAVPNFFAGKVDAKMEQAILLYNKTYEY